jgi:hypothetical protein
MEKCMNNIDKVTLKAGSYHDVKRVTAVWRNRLITIRNQKSGSLVQKGSFFLEILRKFFFGKRIPLQKESGICKPLTNERETALSEPALFFPLEDLVHEVLEGAGDFRLGEGDNLVDDLQGSLP